MFLPDESRALFEDLARPAPKPAPQPRVSAASIFMFAEQLPQVARNLEITEYQCSYAQKILVAALELLDQQHRYFRLQTFVPAAKKILMQVITHADWHHWHADATRPDILTPDVMKHFSSNEIDVMVHNRAKAGKPENTLAAYVATEGCKAAPRIETVEDREMIRELYFGI